MTTEFSFLASGIKWNCYEWSNNCEHLFFLMKQNIYTHHHSWIWWSIDTYLFLLFSLFYIYHSFSNSFSRLTKQSYYYPSYDSYNYDSKWEKTQTIYYYISQAKWCNRKHISIHVILPNKCIVRKIETQDYLINSFFILLCPIPTVYYDRWYYPLRYVYTYIIIFGMYRLLNESVAFSFLSLKYGRRALDYLSRYKAAEVCSLRPIYYFIFRMLLTSDDSEAFFGWRWWWWWW